jgi:hypothetical protein
MKVGDKVKVTSSWSSMHGKKGIIDSAGKGGFNVDMSYNGHITWFSEDELALVDSRFEVGNRVSVPGGRGKIVQISEDGEKIVVEMDGSEDFRNYLSSTAILLEDGSSGKTKAAVEFDPISVTLENNDRLVLVRMDDGSVLTVNRAMSNFEFIPAEVVKAIRSWNE